MRSLLRSLDAGDPGHGEHVTLRDRARRDRGSGLRLHVDATPGDGPAVARFLGRDVDHASPAEGIEMRELRRHGGEV
jgi:hypothetical protein